MQAGTGPRHTRRVGQWTEFLAQDVRVAWRSACAHRVFTAIVVLTIALGIGANTAIFSVVDAVLLRPLPFAHGERIVSLWDTNPDKTVLRFGVSLPDFRDWKARTHSFTDMALYAGGLTSIAGRDGPESATWLVVTPKFLDVLGVHPMLGRSFGPDDARGETSNAVLISYGFYLRHFGGHRSALGSQLSINGRLRTVIGVLPRSADLLGPAFVGAPLDVITVVEFTTYSAVERHAQHLFGAIARLKPGVTVDAARADLYSVEVQVAHENPEIAGWTASLFRLSEDLSLGTRAPLLVLLGAAVLVLLIACANVANLLLVRGAARGREIAVRQALGASRGRLVTQLVVESVLLAAAGAAIGVAMAGVALRTLGDAIPAGVIPRTGGFGLDAGVIAFALGLSLCSAVLFGLWPAVRASLPSLGRALRDGGRGNTGDGRAHRTRRLLVIGELSLTVVLAVCAALVAKSLARMMRVDPGFRPEHAITAQITLGSGYPDSTGIAFYRSLLNDLDARPDIIAAGATDTPPLVGGGVFTSIRLVGQPPRPPNDPLMSTIRFVTPGFFRAMGMRMLGGRDVAWDEAAPTIVLSQTAARTFWPAASVIDQQIAFNTQPAGYQIVGEVNDAAQTSLASPPAPVVYVSMRRSVRLLHTMTLVVRGRGNAASLTPIVREAVHDIDPGLPIYNVQTLQSIVDHSVAQPRLNGALMAVFAIAALLLAALGLYGVVSYSVTQRRQELGLRVALGAQPGAVLRLVLGEGIALASIGIAIGGVGAFFAARIIRSWLFGIGPADPASFAGVAVLLAGVAIAASYLPARRASRVSPLTAMRGD